MSGAPTTHLVLFLRADEEEHALYLVTNEIFLDREAKLIERKEQSSLYSMAVPLLIPTKELCITFALRVPPTTEHIRELADLVVIGLLIGYCVQGEIDLGGRVINNLGNGE